MAFMSCTLAFCLAPILTHIPSGFLSGIYSGLLSGSYSDILSGIYSDIFLSGIQSVQGGDDNEGEGGGKEEGRSRRSTKEEDRTEGVLSCTFVKNREALTWQVGD